MRKELLQRFGLVIVLVIVVLLVYLLVWWGYTRYLKRVGSELVTQSVPYEQMLDRPRARLLVVGDSTAVGVGADSPQETVAGRVGAEAPSLAIVNDAVSGMEAHELAPRMKMYESDAFDAVYIEIGGNDIISLTSIDAVEASMRTVLQEAKRVAPEVLLVTNGNFRTTPALPYGFRWIWERHAKKQRALFEALGEEYDVRVQNHFRPIETFKDVDLMAMHARDRFHLSSQGYASVYESLRPHFVAMGLIQE